MREERKKWIRRISAFITKFLNSALALKVCKLHYLKTASLLHPDSSLLGRRWQVFRPFDVWFLGAKCIIWNLLFFHLACFTITKVSAFRCLLEPPLWFVCRGNRSFHLLPWNCDLQNIFETLHSVFYMIILLILMIKVIGAHCQKFSEIF